MLGDMVVAYLFLGGAGAGACAAACILALAVPRSAIEVAGVPARRHRVFFPGEPYKRLFAPTFAIAAGALVLGCVCLMADLGMASRAMLLFACPTPTFITAGSYALAVDIACCMLLALAWAVPALGWRLRTVRALQAAALAASLFVMVYTGLLLSTVGTVPLWSTAWLPVLFALSAASSGMALLVGASCFTGAREAFSSVLAKVLKVDMAVLMLEAVSACMFLAAAMASSFEVAGAGAAELVSGQLSEVFVLGFAACGIAAPAILEASMAALRRQPAVALLAVAAAVLTGALCLRYGIVMAGAHPPVWMEVL